MVPKDIQLQKHLLKLFHDLAAGGYSGVTTIMKRLITMVYWRGMQKDVRNYI